MRYLLVAIVLVALVGLTSWSQNIDGCPSCGGLVLQPQEAAYIDPQEDLRPSRDLEGYRCSPNHVAKCKTLRCTNSGGTIGSWRFASWKFVSDNVPYPRCVVDPDPYSQCHYDSKICGYYYYVLQNCMGSVRSKPGYIEACRR